MFTADTGAKRTRRAVSAVFKNNSRDHPTFPLQPLPKPATVAHSF